MLNYLRYFIVLLLLGTLFYNYTLKIEPSTIKDKLDRKLPIAIEKKGFVLTLKHIDVIDISDNIIESKIDASVMVSGSNRFSKLLPKKPIQLHITSKTIPKINGKYLSFEVLSLKINRVINIKEVKGLLKKKLEAIKIRLKKLDKISWLAEVKDLRFQDDGTLLVSLGLSKFVIFLLIPLFLLREIGLFFIAIYQKFISPRKKYRCAKGELHGDGTCSSVTKKAFKNGGFIAGMKAYRASTKECKKAYKTLKKEERSDGMLCDLTSGCCSVPSCGGEVTGSATGICDIGAVPCDVGSF